MPQSWTTWLPRYYPRFNARVFEPCLQEIRESRLPLEEFFFILIGCGYLFQVRRPDPERVYEQTLHAISDDPRTVELVLDEKKLRKKIARLGLVIGPDERPLTALHTRGPRPRPTARIAALAIDTWIRRKRPASDPTEGVCALHHALSGQSIQPTTFLRMRKQAERVTIMQYIPAEHAVSAIDHLVNMFETRYHRYRRDYPNRAFTEEDMAELYPIRGVLDLVLKAVGVELPPQQLIRSGKGRKLVWS